MLDFKNKNENPVTINSMKLVAEGQSRKVYTSFEHKNLLIKVQKNDFSARRFFQKWKVLVKLRTFYKQTVPLQREIREYTKIKSEGQLTSQYLQRFVGLIPTPQGNGLLVEAARRKNGHLALTLKEVVAEGHFDDKLHSELRNFLRWFVASKIVATDVHLDNIVFDEVNNRLILIDGIGDKTLIPLRAWFPALNQMNKKRIAKNIYSQVAINFMSSTVKKKALMLLCFISCVALGIDLQDGVLFNWV